MTIAPLAKIRPMISLLSGSPGTSTRENAPHRVIALVARVLEQWAVGPGHRRSDGPWPGEGRRGVDRELVVEIVGAGSRQAFDQPHAGAKAGGRAALEHPVVEVRGFHDESIAFPVPTRVAQPLADG